MAITEITFQPEGLMLKLTIVSLNLLFWSPYMFGKTVELKSEVKSFGQPIIYDQSQYYYIPQISADAAKSGGLSLSYSGAGSDSVLGYSSFIGSRSCNYENIILVDKIHLNKKLLFEALSQIESFFILDPKQTKDNPELSKRLFVISRVNNESPRRLSIAHLDGSGIKTLTPENMDVTSLDFDIKRGRAFALLKKKDVKDSPSVPNLIDLKLEAQAVPMVP